MQRLQITFGKFGALKYTGNLDVSKVWERVLRRAKLPLLYTQGFNTRPRIQLASMLPMGVTSECEVIDVALREVMPSLDGIAEQIEAVAPDGLKVFAVESIPVNSPPLQTLIRSAEYRIQFVDGIAQDELQTRIDTILAQERIVKVVQRKRKKSSYDLRPLILALLVDESGDMIAHLSAGERGNLPPEELLEQMGLHDQHARVHKFVMHIEQYAHHTLLNKHERDLRTD